jgi:hypothetical protein
MPIKSRTFKVNRDHTAAATLKLKGKRSRTSRDDDDEARIDRDALLAEYDEQQQRGKSKATRLSTIRHHKKKKYDEEALDFDAHKKKPEVVLDVTRVKKSMRRLDKEKKSVPDDVVAVVAAARESAKNKDDSDFLNVYLDMYNKQRRIIRRTERRLLGPNSKGGGREIYQLAQMYSQLRETIADLRSISDLSEHAERIIDLALNPLFRILVQTLTASMYQIKIRSKDRLGKHYRDVHEHIDDTTVEFGRAMQEQYEIVSNKIRSLLTEEQSNKK